MVCGKVEKTRYAENSEGQPTFLHMGGAFPFMQSGDRKILFVTWSTPVDFDCHSCAPVVSAAVFTQAGGSWKVAVADPAITAAGGFGKPGTFKRTR